MGIDKGLDLKIEIVNSLDSELREAVVDLLAKSFPVNYIKGRRLYEAEVDHSPYRRYLVVSTGQKIDGVLSIVNRVMNFQGLPLSVAGMSFMAVSHTSKNLQVTNLIKGALAEKIWSESDIALGFARRVMDNYWTPYGFLGFSCHGQFIMELNQIRTTRQDSFLPIDDVGSLDIDQLNRTYEESYANCVGNLKRDDRLWKYYLGKLKSSGYKLATYSQGENVLAYLIHRGNEILELASTSNLQDSCSEAGLKNYFKREGIDTVKFMVNRNHPSIVALSEKYSHEWNERFSWNGGHIIRINGALSAKKIINHLFHTKKITEKEFATLVAEVEASTSDQEISHETTRKVMCGQLDGLRRYAQVPQIDHF